MLRRAVAHLIVLCQLASYHHVRASVPWWRCALNSSRSVLHGSHPVTAQALWRLPYHAVACSDDIRWQPCDVRCRPVHAHSRRRRASHHAAESFAPCAQVMNELPYLVEWITYYHIQGAHPLPVDI